MKEGENVTKTPPDNSAKAPFRDPPFRIAAHRRGFKAGVDQEAVNRLNEELEIEEMMKAGRVALKK